MTTIKFYNKTSNFYEFSNYYLSPLKIDGVQYCCSEVYFQSQKFYVENDQDLDRVEYYHLIQQTDSPQKSKNMGCQRKNFRGNSWFINKNFKNLELVNDVIYKFKDVKIRDDWDQVKVDVMRKVIYAKFTQNSKLSKLLVSTSPHHILEDSPRDDFWGGKGNLLGKLLVELREQI
jgi:predicted NAD-dependent protein-ADP-ribosyltransferase YbiA (DUF1768 family)